MTNASGESFGDLPLKLEVTQEPLIETVGYSAFAAKLVVKEPNFRITRTRTSRRNTVEATQIPHAILCESNQVLWHSSRPIAFRALANLRKFGKRYYIPLLVSAIYNEREQGWCANRAMHLHEGDIGLWKHGRKRLFNSLNVEARSRAWQHALVKCGYE